MRAADFDIAVLDMSMPGRSGIELIRLVRWIHASFDVTCSFKVLAHIPDIRIALSEMARVTRPGEGRNPTTEQ